jgi:AhpD family alkylhydroperoxidase
LVAAHLPGSQQHVLHWFQALDTPADFAALKANQARPATTNPGTAILYAEGRRAVHIPFLCSVMVMRNEKKPHQKVPVWMHQETESSKGAHMQARIKNPFSLLPDTVPALLAVNKSAEDGLPFVTRKLVHVRASQINGCSVCVDIHSHELKKAGESDERPFAVAAWRDAPYFTDAERAALALTEAVTRLSDRVDPVPDEIWNEAARNYDERARHHAGVLTQSCRRKYPNDVFEVSE